MNEWDGWTDGPKGRVQAAGRVQGLVPANTCLSTARRRRAE
jgi:hypothetical protein